MAKKNKKEKSLEDIKRIYLAESDVCMFDLLASEKVPSGLTYEEAFELYIESMKWANGDKFFIVRDGEEPQELKK